ncbi:MAG: Ig-like domain-containing protein, partial [Ignavibacteria bacterium]|nr:Ig-like domain-containing protein [Ignavibacteria bacterium]
MDIINYMNLKKYKVILISLIIFSNLPSINIYAQFADIIPSSNSIQATEFSEHKNQSKIWKHDNIWWSVISVQGGTYIYHLSGNSWVRGLQLTTLITKFKADTKVDGDTTHILLFRDAINSKFISVEYVTASKEYIVPGSGPGLVTLTLGTGDVNSATIDKDSNGRIWLAYDAETPGKPQKHDILVQWSDSPYSSWNGPHYLTRVNFDDICSVTAFTTNGTPRIGVLSSNQTVNKFHFRSHTDGNDPTSWSGFETAASGSDITDNHINLAVHSDGTIYSAIKTNLDSGKEITIGLLVRKPDGTWNLYNVTTGSGTRPIVVLDESNNRVYVFYTKNSTGAGDIVYRYSNADNISFSTIHYTIDGGTNNNVTSTKQNFTDEVVVLYSDNNKIWRSVTAGNDFLNGQPVIDPISTQNMIEMETLVVPISAVDPEGGAITFSVNNLPSFGALTDNGDGTGFITFTPGINKSGTYNNIQVIAIDDGVPQASSSEFFSLDVADLNRKPVLDLIANQLMNEGNSLGVAVNSTDPDGNDITLTASNLPSFGSFTDNGDGTGLISFLPGFAVAGSYPNIKVTATDNGTPTLFDITTFTLTVNDVNGQPVLDPITDQNMNEGGSLDVAVNSTDPDGDNITLTVNNLPSFGSFTDNGDGTGLISFLPGFGVAGSYPN